VEIALTANSLETTRNYRNQLYYKWNTWISL